MPKNTSRSTSKMNAEMQTSGMSKLLLAVIALFFVGLVVMSFKYMMMKRSWNMYAVQMLQSTDARRQLNSVEDASLVAMTVGQFPSGDPLYKQAKELQTYVTNFSKQTHRDLVVVDANQMILADTVPANVGKKFVESKNGEVAKTITDGLLRTFTETSVDYPLGINQTVAVLKDASTKTVGAVIMSTSTIFN